MKTKHDISTLFAQLNDSTSTASSSVTTASPSPSLATGPHDLYCLAKDLKLACGDLLSLIKRINSIANCFEEKLMSILIDDKGLVDQVPIRSGNQARMNRRSHKNKHQGHESQGTQQKKQKDINRPEVSKKTVSFDKLRSTDSSPSIETSGPNKTPENQDPHRTDEELMRFVERLSNKTRSKSQPVIKQESPRRPASLYNQKSDDSSDDVTGVIDEANPKPDAMESSFYEDKLEDELEKLIDSNTKPVDKNTFGSRIKNGKTKPTNTNHHVCFNLNNTIFSTRADHPPLRPEPKPGPVEIPIRILRDESPKSKALGKHAHFELDKKPTDINPKKSSESKTTKTGKNLKIDIKTTNL